MVARVTPDFTWEGSLPAREPSKDSLARGRDDVFEGAKETSHLTAEASFETPSVSFEGLAEGDVFSGVVEQNVDSSSGAFDIAIGHNGRDVLGLPSVADGDDFDLE